MWQKQSKHNIPLPAVSFLPNPFYLCSNATNQSLFSYSKTVVVLLQWLWWTWYDLYWKETAKGFFIIPKKNQTNFFCLCDKNSLNIKSASLLFLFCSILFIYVLMLQIKGFSPTPKQQEAFSSRYDEVDMTLLERNSKGVFYHTKEKSN